MWAFQKYSLLPGQDLRQGCFFSACWRQEEPTAFAVTASPCIVVSPIDAAWLAEHDGPLCFDEQTPIACSISSMVMRCLAAALVGDATRIDTHVLRPSGSSSVQRVVTLLSPTVKTGDATENCLHYPEGLTAPHSRAYLLGIRPTRRAFVSSS